MPAFEQKTVIRSYKLRIKNKFESVAEETDNVISLLRSSVSVFRNRMKDVVENNDENFFTLFKTLNGDFEKYQDKLYLFLAEFDNQTLEDNCENSGISDEKDQKLPELPLQKTSIDRNVNTVFSSQASSISSASAPIDRNDNAALPSQASSISFTPAPIDANANASLLSTASSISSTSASIDANVNAAVPSQASSIPSTFAAIDGDVSAALDSQASSISSTFAAIDTNVNTALPSQASSISSASYRSFQEEYTSSISQQHVNQEQQTISQFSSLPYKTYNAVDNSDVQLPHQRTMNDFAPTYDLHSESPRTFSQSSCYRSLSSNISASQGSSVSLDHIAATEIDKTENFKGREASGYSQQLQSKPTILTLSISVPTTISATLTHIITPDDFWMQLENSKALSVPLSQFCEINPVVCVQEGDFCYAPFKSVPYYYRAKVLSLFPEDEVEVFFIDHGSTQVVPSQSLRPLPPAAYQIPTQAIHCCLCDISPLDGKWTESSIEKMKEFQNNSIETRIKSLQHGTYAVQLISTVSAFFGEDYSFDIAQSLCVDGLATTSDSSHLQLAVSEISNQTSCDSGVSITSNQRSSPSNRLCLSSDILSESDPFKVAAVEAKAGLRKVAADLSLDLKATPDNYIKIDTNDLISFESAEEVYNTNPSPIPEVCSRIPGCSCALHLVVPPPVMQFVESDMILVMLSNICTPSEFYVNSAMDVCLTLDELREQMTASYESLSPCDNLIDFASVQEGMYLAGRYDEDKNWYRVQVLRINSESARSCDVYVQYVDYGNKALMKFSDLRPLTPQFAAHPSFAIQCSLLGVTPKSEEKSLDDENGVISTWSEKATAQFRLLTSYDRVLTAQICRNMPAIRPSLASAESKTLHVLLWDTEEAKDLLINEALVELGVADFDRILYEEVLELNKKIDQKDAPVLNQWNPMNEDFTDIENSYGVHAEEGEVAIAGYKAKDESYICKYFSLRGYCPRGEKCEFEHLHLGEGGVTRDRGSEFSIDALLHLPSISSHILVQVSAVTTPRQFFCILPFGKKDVDEIDSLAGRGCLQECSMKEEVTALFSEMNHYYSNAPFAEKTSVAVAYGSVVAAWRRANNSWHRGRVIDVDGLKDPVRIFFVDYGDEDWIPRGGIREILPQFLFTPFQAIECRLSDVEPLGCENGMTWSPNSVHYFKELVAMEVLLAHVTNRCGRVMYLTLRKTTATDHQSISESLVREGYAQYRNKNSSSKKEKGLYGPG